MRQIFLLVILFFVSQWLVKMLRRTGARPPRAGAVQPGATQKSAQRPAPAAPPRLAEPMIRCAECGVHAPKSDSVVVAGKAFCGADHARRYAARPVGRDGR
jgi:uncharacterized protein